MSSATWAALYYGGLAVVVAVGGLPSWVVVAATVAVIVGYGLHLRLALLMLDQWYARADRDS